jgi:mannan endo-1,4-beta-mannosidase
MASANTMGASVLRCWAFLDVDEFVPGQVAFQYVKNGKIVVNDGPDGLERLDRLIHVAEDMNIKLILPLVNHWADFGGMPMYVKWLAAGSDATEFYRSPVIREAYLEWVSQVLTRRNRLTGRLYREEPAVMAWELTNEARCQTEGGKQILLDWVNEMAAFVKRHDANHLLALGDEGFFFKQGRGHLYDGRYGVDWTANLAVPEIDFGTYHFYPQHWGHGKKLDFGKRWIADHQRIAAELNKPAVMEEFGLKGISDEEKGRWLGRWQKMAHGGSLLWMLGHQSSETSSYVDDYVVYL